MPNHKYKLIYFDTSGLAEPIRWMFAYKNVPFEDHRIKELPFYLTQQPNPEWDALKEKMPYGVVPVLEVDGNGQFLGETAAIARYVGKQVGLSGENDWDEAQADSIMSYIAADFYAAVGAWAKEPDAEKKQEALKKLPSQIKKVGATLEKILLKNNDGHGNGFFVGQTPTMADFFAVTFCTLCEFVGQPAKFPALQTHRELISDLPGVKEFIQTHKK